MKKYLTLAAAGTLAAASFSAQAQVVVDGVLNATEIGAANTGKYVLLGKFTNPRGFGDWGLMSLYAANTATKVYFFVGGTVESSTNSSNSLQLYIDLPGTPGAPTTTPLPAPIVAPPSNGTSFAGMVAKMDIAPDFAIAVKGNGTGLGGSMGTIIPQAVVYTSATIATDQDLMPDLPNSGAATPIMSTSTAGVFAKLAGARMSYKNSPDGTLLTNPGNVAGAAYGAAGSYGWEIELDRTALGVTTPAALGVFALQNNAGGDYLSSDFIPQSPNPPTTNSGNLATASMVDFATISGVQRATFNVVAVLGTKGEELANVAVNIHPNPSMGQTTITYQVAERTSQVQVVLTDLMGRTVQVLESGEKAVGSQTVGLSTANVAAGTYLVRVQVGDKATTRKVVLL